VLEKGDVGLVWFEMVQGYAAKPIPDELLQIINSLKRSHGFLVGVDEVFTGVWRAGRFLCHEGRVDSDVTVLSKPLSDITVPMAAVLARESVYRRACKRGPEWVRFMEGYFRNQLGAHVASHALAKVTAEGHMRARQAKDEPFVTFAKVSSAFGPVLGRGYVSRLSLNPRYFPFTARSTIRQLLELGLSSLIREKAGVLLLNLRFFQPIFGDRNDLQEAIRRVERVVQEIKPWTVYAYTVALLLLSGSRRSLARLNAFVARRRTEVQAGLETTEVSRGR
jgi:acetylornithine/succinyldiaminopimelate/putrescine aminotransferase